MQKFCKGEGGGGGGGGQTWSILKTAASSVMEALEDKVKINLVI